MICTQQDGEVDGTGGARGERDGDDLAAFAQHGQGAMSAVQAELVDVGVERFGDPQPVDGQQRANACSGAASSPAATSSAPTSLRSNPTAGSPWVRRRPPWDR
jgi:hypothetical protein